ncbi:MAG TPA: hypothetical protein VHY08_01955 [Bacillota bacterium]|nr:hypothetical protein [Bacillota bacterium]
MSVNLGIDQNVNQKGQFVKDQNGNTCKLSLSVDKVGIGTDNPSSTLTVVGGGSPPLVVKGDAQNYAMIGLLGDEAAKDWQIQATNTGSTEFRIAFTQNNPLLHLNQNGDLTVKGSIKASAMVLPRNPNAPSPPAIPNPIKGQMFWDDSSIWVYTGKWEKAQLGEP